MQLAIPLYRYCVVTGCSNVVTPKGLNNYKGPMHKFPNKGRSPAQFQKWMDFCNRHPMWQPVSTSHICNDHFDTNAGVLKAPTVPTILVKKTHLEEPDLPLDKTLELFEDQNASDTLSGDPTSTCLPADKTLDTTVESFDLDIAMGAESYRSVVLWKCVWQT